MNPMPLTSSFSVTKMIESKTPWGFDGRDYSTYHGSIEIMVLCLLSSEIDGQIPILLVEIHMFELA